MFRHLSPKNAAQGGKPTQQSNKYGGVVQNVQKQGKVEEKVMTPTTKDIKNLNNFFSKGQQNNQKKVSIPSPPLVKHTNSST